LHSFQYLALAVVRTNPNAAESQERIDNYRCLAETVWKKRSMGNGGLTLSIMKEQYNAALEEFRAMKKNARDYLAHEQTVAFLQRGALDQQGDFTRQMAVNEVYKPSNTDQYFNNLSRRMCAYDQLKNRNFENLRLIHEAYFRRPSQYGMGER
jgi:hypothetical protein